MSTAKPEPKRCTGKTKAGPRCQNYVTHRSGKCVSHRNG